MRRICSIFGVASELMGDSENKTYSNYQEARKALYEETILPLMDVFTAELNSWLVPLYGTGNVLDYDRDSIEALQEDREKKYNYLKGADWISTNEKRDATGFDEVVGGDEILVPISYVPLDAVSYAGEDDESDDQDDDQGDGQDAQGDAGDATDDAVVIDDGSKRRTRQARPGRFTKVRRIRAIKKSFWTEKGRRGKLWTAFDLRSKARARSFEPKAIRYMMRQADDIRERALKYPSVHSIDASFLLDVKEEAKRFQKEFRAWYFDHAIRAGNAGAHAAKGELLDDAEMKGLVTRAGKKPAKWTFDLSPAQEEKLMDMVYNSGSTVNESTLDIVYRTLKYAQADNATVEQFAQQIWEQVDEFSASRARLWANTESTKVDNWGMLEGFKATEFVESKGWNCQMLDTSRDDHIEADGQERALGEPFDIGGEMLDYPGDPAGSAGNVCNCRCSQYPIVSEEAVEGEE
jgi:hypothetical protein